MLFHNKEQMYEISPLLFPSLTFIAFTKMLDGFISLVWCLHIYLSMYFFWLWQSQGLILPQFWDSHIVILPLFISAVAITWQHCPWRSHTYSYCAHTHLCSYIQIPATTNTCAHILVLTYTCVHTYIYIHSQTCAHMHILMITHTSVLIHSYRLTDSCSCSFTHTPDCSAT